MIDPKHVVRLKRKAPDDIVERLFADRGDLLVDMLLCVLAKLSRFRDKTGEICFDLFFRTQKELAASRIHRLTVQIDDVIVLENMFTRVKIESFDLRLCVLEGSGDHLVLYRLIRRDAESSHQIFDRIAREDAHQRILE